MTKRKNSDTPSGESDSNFKAPDSLIEARRLDAEFDRLVAARDDADNLAAEATAELEESLSGVDLRDERQLTKIAALQIRASLAPKQSELLDAEITQLRPALRNASIRALHEINLLCDEMARAEQDFSARKASQFFVSRSDALKAFADVEHVTRWREKRQAEGGWYDAIPSVEKTLSIAREVLPALESMRSKLAEVSAAASETTEVSA